MFKGRGFESQHCILDGHFSHLFVVNVVMLFEKTKINENVVWDGPFFKKNISKTIWLLDFAVGTSLQNVNWIKAIKPFKRRIVFRVILCPIRVVVFADHLRHRYFFPGTGEPFRQTASPLSHDLTT